MMQLFFKAATKTLDQTN